MGLFRTKRTTTYRIEAEISKQLPIDERCGAEFGCGSCSSKRYPISFLQCFATSKGAVVFLSIAAILQGFIVNGNTNAVITTIEKRFELSSTESGLFVSCYDIAACISSPFITYIASRRHKPIWLGWGIILMGLGSILFSLPHFVAPTYTFTDSANTCANPASTSCVISTLKNYRFVFYLGMLIIGIGANPLFSLGVTYLDENVKQRFSALYNSIYLGSSVFGPGIGFLIGGALLRTYTNPGETVSITESSESWVGAWWLGSLLAGGLSVLAAIPVLMYPKRLYNWKKHRQSRAIEAYVNTDDRVEFGKRFQDIPKCFLILFKNRTFIWLGMAATIDSMTVNALGAFGPKYIETVFGFEPSAAGTYFGLLAILGAVSGHLVGGMVISKFDLSLKRMLQMTYLFPLLCIILNAGYFISCADIQMMAGVNTAYHDSSSQSTVDLTSTCNANCGCSSDVYSPVCGNDNVMYFSPCFAGCRSEKETTFLNCSCIAAASTDLAGNSSSRAKNTATLGFCTGTGCGGGLFVVFCALQFFVMFFTFFNEASAVQATLRVVSFHQRTFALGVQWMVIRLFGAIPGPLILGAIFDSACASWSMKCGERGSCLTYHISKLPLYVFLFSTIAKVVNAAAFFIASHSYKPVEDPTHNQGHRSKSLSASEHFETTTKRSVSAAVSEQPPSTNDINGTATTTTLPGEVESTRSSGTSDGPYLASEEDPVA